MLRAYGKAVLAINPGYIVVIKTNALEGQIVG